MSPRVRKTQNNVNMQSAQTKSMKSTMESVRGASCSPRALPDDGASYFDLNQKLSFPNNPAYFSIKKLKTSSTK